MEISDLKFYRVRKGKRLQYFIFFKVLEEVFKILIKCKILNECVLVLFSVVFN